MVAPPSILSGIEEEYIQGVTRIEDGKLVILMNIEKMFFEDDLKNLQKNLEDA